MLSRERKNSYSKSSTLSGEVFKSGPVLVGMSGLAWPAIRQLVLTSDGIRLMVPSCTPQMTRKHTNTLPAESGW